MTIGPGAAPLLLIGVGVLLILATAVLLLRSDARVPLLAQALVDQLPVPAAILSRQLDVKSGNAAWRSSDELARTKALAEAVEAAHSSQARTGSASSELHVIYARRLDTLRGRFLVIATPREASVHLVAELGSMAHEAPKYWATIGDWLADVLANGEHSSALHELFHNESYRGHIEASHHALQTLVPRMSGVLLGQTLVPEEVDLRSLLTDVCKQLRARLAVELEFGASVPADARVTVRKNNIYEIFELLVDNSLRHGKSTAARVLVGATPAPKAESGLVTRRWAVIHFIDNGEGFDPDILEKVQTNRPLGRDSRQRSMYGLGQGLRLCGALARQNGGVLAVQEGSEPPGQPPDGQLGGEGLECGMASGDGQRGAWLTLKLPLSR